MFEVDILSRLSGHLGGLIIKVVLLLRCSNREVVTVYVYSQEMKCRCTMTQ